MKINEILTEAANPAQQAAIAISMKKAGTKPKSQVNELAPDAGGGGSGNYFQALASAWYNHDISMLADIARKGGSPLKKITDAQEAVEKMLQRGVIGSDGKTRKYDITYNSDFDGVVIQSKDYYEYSDYDAAGNEVDSRNGRPWGPNDYMEFGGDDLDEGMYETNPELTEEFDLIESIIERLAEHNGVDAEMIWADLETLTEDELYAFAVTSEPIMESTRKGEYGRVLDALGLYYPRISMEELNTPGYYKVIANKADVPVEYAAQVIDGFVNDDRYYDNEDDEEQGVAEGQADQVKKIVKKNGKPVGEIGTDPEASPGNGNWYVKHYASGYDVVGFDNAEEALAELKHCMKQGVAEAKADSTGTWVVYNGSKVTKFKTREGAKAYAEKNGGTVASSEYYHDKIQKQDVAEDAGDSQIKPGMKTQYGTVVSVKGNTVTVRASNGELTTVNIHDIKKGVAEDWQKANKRDKTDGMSQKAVNAYRRENPGSKLKTAVTTKPSKLKKGGRASKRRKSYCSRSRGQMKMHSISCAKTPDKAICKARRRWNC
jgi:hypothetical protein